MKTRTDLALIREILETADATSCYEAGKRHGLHHKTIYRWKAYRDQHPGWPTDQDIVEHQRAAELLAERRARGAAVNRSYRKRRYLNRDQPLMVPAIGTQRRLRALFALGWTSRDLAPLLGVGDARVGYLASDRQSTVLPDTAARVAAVYERLSMTIPTDPPRLSPRHCGVRARQRRLAVRRGWAPPLAWDNIDDPAERPSDWRYTPASRSEALTELVDRGAGISEVCSTLHVSREALEKWCARHGRSTEFSVLVSRESWSVAS